MRPFGIILLTAAAALSAAAAKPVRLDRAGEGRYGTNYTVPFAHAYRTLGRLGVDRKAAIERDVYHMSRLGLNAFRLHLWDVELTDSAGNLLENDHLDLLDYLIAQLKKRGIETVLTAQTNFGNGYPERNTDPNGAYSYRYDKCHVHDNPAAIAAQERYIQALVKHTNPYTGLTLAADPSIIAIEINNEPCHSAPGPQVTAYIDRMADAMRRAGWKKEILYNVSHNREIAPAYYDARIDGTTYQWYPSGLVSGRTRRGNFLPVLDNYSIAHDTIAGFNRLSRIVYEFDPADVLDTYLYPAAARTFRKAGMAWATQFAYDPMDMARFNTEYQTHFLNLAYTPGKAIGMMIAAEIMKRTPRGKDYGKYPADTVFGDFSVSARRNLAMLNDGESYLHTNNTSDRPANLDKLKRVAGVGSSPLVTTDGTGAYFLDRLDAGTWRLELMPDVELTADPFATPSPARTVGEIIAAPVAMTISLPGLPDNFTVKPLGRQSSEAHGHSAVLRPGVYLLGKNVDNYTGADTYGDGKRLVGEYVAPSARQFNDVLLHTPRAFVREGSPLELTAKVVSATSPDSVVVYPSDISFWSDTNRLFRMERDGKRGYRVTLPADCPTDYNIVVWHAGKATTWPGARPGTPLDWDFAPGARYSVRRTPQSGPVALLDAAADGTDGLEMSTIPEQWRGISIKTVKNSPFGADCIRIDRTESADTTCIVLTKHVSDVTRCIDSPLNGCSLSVRFGHVTGLRNLRAGIITADGFTYTAPVALSGDTATIPLDKLTLGATPLVPAPYPVFLERWFVPDPATAIAPRSAADIEMLVITADAGGPAASLEITGAWLD